MKKLLLIIGIVILVVCVLFLLFAALNLFGYYHVLDGSPALYDRLHRRMIVFSASGVALAVIGAVCLIVRSRIK